MRLSSKSVEKRIRNLFFVAWAFFLPAFPRLASDPDEEREEPILYGITYRVDPNAERMLFEGEYTPIEVNKPDSGDSEDSGAKESPFIRLPVKDRPVPDCFGVFKSNGKIVKAFRSDSEGHFTVKGLPEGEYEVIVENRSLGLIGRKRLTIFYVDHQTGLTIPLSPRSEGNEGRIGPGAGNFSKEPNRSGRDNWGNRFPSPPTGFPEGGNVGNVGAFSTFPDVFLSAPYVSASPLPSYPHRYFKRRSRLR